MEENRKKFIYKLQKNGFEQIDIDLAMYAYDLSKFAHRPQKRDGGERYFNHPRETAIILLDEIGTTDINEVIIQLLHDTGEDTGMFGNIIESYELFKRTAIFRLTKSFNVEVSHGVIVYTKPHVDGVYFKDKAYMIDFYITQLKDNPKIFLLKMLDRLHNLRSLPEINLTKVEKQIKETREVLLPAFESVIKLDIVSDDLYERGKKVQLKIFQELFKLEKVLFVQ